MRKKWLLTLIISIVIITGFVIVFPNNVIDLKVGKIENNNHIMYDLFYYITFLGSRTVLIPFVILGSIYLLFIFKKIQPSVIFISGSLISYFLNTLIKEIITRDRPSILEAVHGVGYSFPSGHAMISTVCYGLFAFYLCQKAKTKDRKHIIIVLTTVLLLLIGYSRVGLGVHYVTDVLAGYLFGVLVLYVYLKLFKQISH